MGEAPNIRVTEADERLRARFTIWLQNVVRHATIDYIRRQHHYGHEVPFSELPENLMPMISEPQCSITDSFQFEEERLANAFVQLPLMRRRILELLFVEDLPPSVVAKKLNCSIEYVYKQKHNALKRLREQLTEDSK